MAALPSSGEISLGDIKANRAGSTGTDPISLKTESETFASGSIVDGSGAQTTARSNLIAQPYSISEFYDSNFSSDEFSSIVITTAGGTSDFNVVDGEDLTVAFATTQTGTHTVQLVDSSNNIDDSETGSPSSGTVSVTFSSLALTDDTYTPRLRLGFLTQDGTNINYHDAIASVAVTDPDASSTPTVAANSTSTAIEHTISSIGNSNAIAHYNWEFAKVDGDSIGLNSGEGSDANTITLTATSDASPTITYKGPGQFSINLRVDGNPTQARNSATATQVLHEIHYIDATTINSISSVNAGTAVTVAGTHKGLSGGVTFGLVSSSAATTFLSSKSTNDTRDSRITARSYTDDITAADSNTTLSLQGRVIDRSDGTTGQNRNTSTFSVFPLLSNSKNTINPSTNTVYSSTNNTSATTFNGDSTNYVNSVTYGTPGTPTDNVTAYAYSINTAPTGWSFSSPNSETTNFSGGTGVAASKTVQLDISSTAAAGDSASDQSSVSTHTLAILFKPCIIAVTHTGGTIVVNDTEVVVSALSWQGFADSTGFQLSIRNSSGTLVGSNTTVNYDNTEGSTTSQISKTSLSINLGNSSSAGTMKVRVARRDNLSTYREFDITISDYTSTTIQGVGAGYGTPEQALIAKLAGGAGWSNTTKFFAPGDSFGDGTILYNDNAGNVFNGGGNYHGIKPGATTSFFSVASNGAIGNVFVGDATIPPRDPTGAGHSATFSSAAASSFDIDDYQFASSGTESATVNKTTTKTVTVTWNDNSNIENGFKIYNTNSSGAVLGTTSANVETKNIGGITGNTTFAVHATGNSNGDESILSLNAATTSYTHNNDGQLYLAFDNTAIATTTATTFTWNKNAIAAGTYTARVTYGNYYNQSGASSVLVSATITVTAASGIAFNPTSISTLQPEDGGGFVWSSAIHATISSGYHGFAGDFTTVAISGTGNFTWTVNAAEGSDPGTSGTGLTSVTLSGTDNDVYFRVRAREVGGSVGDTGNFTVTVTHGATSQTNIVGTFTGDAEIAAAGGGGP